MSFLFICDHCGKKFELETPEAKECPFCFWSSSIKRADEIHAAKKDFLRSSPAVGTRNKHAAFWSSLKYLARILLVLVVLGALGLLGHKLYPKLLSSSAQGWKGFSIKLSHKKIPSEPVPVDPLAQLSPQEEQILFREMAVPLDQAPDAGGEAILKKTVPLQTGWTEKLPSPVWTLEQYQKFIADQEAFYKMPFARSYRKKLEELFKVQYLAAADAFNKGDVLAARNGWVSSLAFPLYSEDLKKHRAVALTMLRPFINDTLSKVSAMNQSLVDKKKKLKEQALSAGYQQLIGVIGQKKWEEALAMIGRMLQEVDQLRKGGMPQEVPPPYPASFGTIDADLQRPLMDLMSPTPSSIADLQPLQQDLVEKKELIETFTEAYLKKVAETYHSALEMIRAKNWQEASRILGMLQGPPTIMQDAAEKLAILEKMSRQDLVSSGKTS